VPITMCSPVASSGGDWVPEIGDMVVMVVSTSMSENL
jgi:hypothetical protein